MLLLQLHLEQFHLILVEMLLLLLLMADKQVYHTLEQLPLLAETASFFLFPLAYLAVSLRPPPDALP